MKLLTTFLLLGVIIAAGCLESPPTMEKYESSEWGIAFEKPQSWTQQPDPLSIVRFSELGKASFSVTFAPGKKAADFDSSSVEIKNSFLRNSGFSNVEVSNTLVSELHSSKIKADQEDAKSELYIVKDTFNNRILLFGFVYNSTKIEPINKKVLSSIRVFERG